MGLVMPMAGALDIGVPWNGEIDMPFPRPPPQNPSFAVLTPPLLSRLPIAVSCGARTPYAAGTPLSALPTPLNAVGNPMGQQLKCYADGVLVPTSDLVLGTPLACPAPLGAPQLVQVCKCGVCTTATIPAVGAWCQHRHWDVCAGCNLKGTRRGGHNQQ
jgi:hypothetical protein